MGRNIRSRRQKADELIRRGENLAKVLQMSKAMQTRFKLIPKAALNNVTVAGIRDMKLGRVKDGKPVGANLVRFNNPSPGTKSDYPRICIDPKGVSNKANPHIRVSQGTIKAAQITQSCLKITGRALLVVSLVASGVRVAKSIYDEVTIDDEIEGLQQIVYALEEDLEDDSCSGPTRVETEDALDYARKLLDDAYDSKRNKGKKTLLTLVCVGGEYGGAAAGGFGGAQAGAAIGMVGGPVGAVVGAVTGGIIGALVGSEIGASAVENFKCDSDGISTELHGSLVDWGGDVQGEVLGLDGNVSLGVGGVELGAHAALFELDVGKQTNFSVGRAGANIDFTKDGVDVGVEGKVFRTEIEDEHIKIGAGLNFDTGFKVGDDGVKMEALGFGFSCDRSGFGIKLPFLDIKFKN
ncbi:hypothetical protein ANCCAN_20382 [Ancylostoma caninum]|uniref:Uncharacterized protein n=1 Tax=Ancylostoma caninum TaxID=29170 RepID=A0A368FNX4_ANCCA|nr:hypothetical protein ANCCAN_20382 [Ancylostoma caninum]